MALMTLEATSAGLRWPHPTWTTKLRVSTRLSACPGSTKAWAPTDALQLRAHQGRTSQGPEGVSCLNRDQCQSNRLSRPNWSRRKQQHSYFITRASTDEVAQASDALKSAASPLADDLRGTSIFLVGMMGSGKSTIGRVLADALGYYFFDSDNVVEQAAGGATVAQIFEENGEEAFRDLETKVLSELSSLGRVVVSTGGGAVIRPTNWSYMDHGITVFIDVPVPVLASRVVSAGTDSRPLLTNSTLEGEVAEEGKREQEEMVKVLEKLQTIFGQRCGLYKNADATVSLQWLSNSKGVPIEGISVEDIASEILGRIKGLVAERKLRDQNVQAKAGS